MTATSLPAGLTRALALPASLTRAIAVPAGRVNLRSAVGRALRVVTPLGWGMVAVAALAGWWGYRLGWLELWVLALAATALLVIATALTLGRSSYRMAVRLTSNRVVVGTTASGAIEATNVGSRVLRPARLELPVGRGVATFALPRLGAGQTHEEVLVIPTGRRGVVVVGPASSVRDDPLRLLRREVRWNEPQDLFVHPVTVALDGSAAGFLRDIEGVTTRDLSSNDVSFHALREYAPGDDRRSVHWRTTARTGRLMVRQFEETRRSHLVVVLSLLASDYVVDDDAGARAGTVRGLTLNATEAEFELAVSAAASLAAAAVREGREVTVLTQDGPLATGSPQRLLDAMCAVELRETGDDIAALARAAADAVPGASAVVTVAGSGVAPSAWQRVSVRVPLGARAFAIACEVGAEASRRALGAFSVVGLGELRDLPRVLVRLGER